MQHRFYTLDVFTATRFQGNPLAVVTDGYRALEGARWAVLEREADSDVAAGRIGQTFTSAADLMADLGG